MRPLRAQVRAWEEKWAGLGWGWLSPCCHVLMQNSEEFEKSRFKPGFPGAYKGTLVEVGEG